MFSLLSFSLVNFSFFSFLLALQMACCAFLFASIYLSFLPSIFHNFHNLFCADIPFLTFSVHQICFLHMPFFVHPQVLAVAKSKPCLNLHQILSTCSPVINFICKSFTKCIMKISWLELPCMFWCKVLTPIFTFYNFCITNKKLVLG